MNRTGKENISRVNKTDQIIKCPICKSYFQKKEGFICPKCKRGPLCKNHRVPREKECASCLYEKTVKEITMLKISEKSIRNFNRLLQFIFLVFATIFISVKMGMVETIEFLQNNILTDYSIYIGVCAFIGSLFFYFILYCQRNRIRELDSKISKTEVSSRFQYR